MPSAATLERFVARVEANAHAEAIEEFYAEHATMQENLSPPRAGREALAENERRVMASAAGVRSRCVRPVFVEGDHVVIRWQFHFTWNDGSTTDIDELAWQRWDHERIVEERFYYDPAQLVRKDPGPTRS